MVSTGNNQPNIRRFFGPKTQKITPISRYQDNDALLEASKLSLHTRLTNARKGPNASHGPSVKSPTIEGKKIQGILHGADFNPTSNTNHI